MFRILLAPAAILGLFVGEGVTPTPEGSDAAELRVSPKSPVASLLPQECAGVPTGANGAVPTADRPSEGLTDSPVSSAARRESHLIAALILEKYLSFRESLTSP